MDDDPVIITYVCRECLTSKKRRCKNATSHSECVLHFRQRALERLCHITALTGCVCKTEKGKDYLPAKWVRQVDRSDD